MKKNIIKTMVTALAFSLTTLLFPLAASAADGDVLLRDQAFPDTDFRSYVTTFDTDHDGVLSAEERAAVTGMDCSFREITTLDGIEYFTELRWLDCSRNALSSLDVSENTELKSLKCYENQLSALDVSKLGALTELNCANNNISSLNVSHNGDLKQLNCSANQLSALNVSKNSALTALYCEQNRIPELDVTKNSTLKVLNCGQNQLSTLDVTKNTSLRVLHCHYNRLTALDLSQNKALRELYCGHNQIDALDLKENKALLYLYCNNNRLTDLDLTANGELITVNCAVNQLPAIDVATAKALKNLYCQSNELTTLEVTANPLLAYLYCYDNQLDAVNVSRCPLVKDAVENGIHTSSAFESYALLPEAELRGDPGLKIFTNSARILEDLEVTTPPTKVTYNEGEEFDSTGMVVTVTYDDGTTGEIDDYTVEPQGPLGPDDDFITVIYSEDGIVRSDTVPITVIPGPTRYGITIEKGRADKPDAPAGDTVTIIADAPPAGQIFAGWVTESANVTFADPAKATTTFTMPAEALTITATYKVHGIGPNPDPIPNPDPDAKGLLNATDHIAFVEGYSDGTVKPEGQVTRAEAATMIYRLLRAAERDKYFTTANKLSDVSVGNWYNKAVSTMNNGEFISGYPDGTFKANRAITRAEIVSIIVRIQKADGGTANFNDTKGHWAEKFIAAASAKKWLEGYPDGSFRPNVEITRAEAMTILNRVLDRGVDEKSELLNCKRFSDNANAQKWYYYEVLEATNSHEYTGKRPSETWTKNEVTGYTYDIDYYERP